MRKLAKTLVFIIMSILLSQAQVVICKETSIMTRIDTPADFNEFLSKRTLDERITLLQALKVLPKLKKEHFGQLDELPDMSFFDEQTSQTPTDQIKKPETFNEVPVETVLSAYNKDIFTLDDLSVERIKKELLYRAYNKATYLFRDEESINYHNIVQDVAVKNKISKQLVESLSTYELEKSIAECYFGKIETTLLDKIKELLKTYGPSILPFKQYSIPGGGTLIQFFIWSPMTYWLKPDIDAVTVFIMSVNMMKTEDAGL
ncbi:hypothetical protein LJC31_04485 [Synergistaceae bacterium OttesenSCG-928-I11]|nr:hypothetical protein [Synergistaceae bacterium OttesenSCG-928-I11]